MANIYSRFRRYPVTVLTATSQESPPDGRVSVVQGRFPKAQWGLLHPTGLVGAIRLARSIRRRTGQSGAVHCCRALPEGLGAVMAGFTRRQPLICWALGEELQYVQTSRELTTLAGGVFRRAETILAISENTASLLDAMGIPRAKVSVVRPGVDAERFAPGESAEAGPKPVLLSVGRLQRRKGHDMVLRALPAVRRAHPGAKYLIAGSGEERPRLEAQAAELGVSGSVEFLGRVDAADLPDVYRRADIFVMPNRDDGPDFEGFGIVFLEAAASGLPALGGRSGGVPEAVQDGVSGVLVDGADIESVTQGILRLAGDADLRERLGRQARERVVGEFSWENAAKAVEQIHARTVTS
jgi:phosphatidyl-myo-inositol dimannoside synthase